MKNTRKATERRREVIFIIAIAIIAIVGNVIINYSSNGFNKVEEEDATIQVIEPRRDSIPQWEIRATEYWLQEQKKKVKAEKFECTAECRDFGELIVLPDELEQSEYDLLCKLVFAESGRRNENEMVAIAATVLNRVNSDEFPNSIEDVIFEDGQFSTAQNHSIYWNPEPDINEKVSEKDITDEVRACVERALNGEDPTRVMVKGGSLYFYSEKYISEEELAKRRNITEKIKFGDTVFY